MFKGYVTALKCDSNKPRPYTIMYTNYFDRPCKQNITLTHFIFNREISHGRP